MAFKPDQIEALKAPLNRAHVRSRTQAGRSLSYVEGWHAIAEANRIFGFDGWHRELVTLREVGEARLVDGKWRVAYLATVRIRVEASDGTFDGTVHVIRDGTGYGSGIDKDLGQAHESALKEAETDAMKRSLMTFGNPFGLALYDKEQREVVDEPTPKDRFLAATHATIDGFGGSRADLVTWWNDPAQKTQRRDFGLTTEEVEALKAKVAAYQEPRQEAAE